jgi:hypothetical protein
VAVVLTLIEIKQYKKHSTNNTKYYKKITCGTDSVVKYNINVRMIT